MRKTLAGLFLGVTLATAAPAVAAPRQPDPNPIQQCLDQVSTDEIARRGIPSCREDSNGNVLPYWPADKPNTGAFLALGLVFVAIGVVWSAIPAFVCHAYAKNAGQPTGVPVLLGLLLGWIGFGFVYLMARQQRQAPLPPPAAIPGGSHRPADRLRALTELYRSGAITESEYTARRTAIIDQV